MSRLFQGEKLKTTLREHEGHMGVKGWWMEIWQLGRLASVDEVGHDVEDGEVRFLD